MKEIDKSEEGYRVDKWFLKKFKNLNNSIVQKLIRKGQIRVNGKKIKGSYLLEEDDVIKYPSNYIDSLEDNTDYSEYQTKPLDKKKVLEIRGAVIYKDDNFIGINKPSGVAVQGGTKINFSIADMVDDLRFGNEESPYILHRLDKDTSGALILARHIHAAREAHKQIKTKFAYKTYYCLVYTGQKKLDLSGEISTPIGRSTLDKEKMSTKGEDRKPAKTEYRVLQSYNDIALLEVDIITGRKHQIRVHMSEVLGCPILGDYKYGYKRDLFPGVNVNRMFLHSKSIELVYEDKVVAVEAPTPIEFEDIIADIAVS